MLNKVITRRLPKLAVAVVATALIATVAVAVPQRQAVEFQTDDGITLVGEIYRAQAPDDAPVVLLFHQGGGSSEEYELIAPRLNEAGYHAIAIDQRNGGDVFGRANRVASGLTPEPGYCDVYPDLEATLREARNRGFSGPLVAWGSSYSAALVVQLGARNPDDVAAVMAFSPASGDSLEGCRPEPWAEQLEQPLFVARPSGELENEGVRQQYDWFDERGAVTFTAVDGRHGSSMLNPERSPSSAEAGWEAALRFLNTHVDE